MRFLAVLAMGLIAPVSLAQVLIEHVGNQAPLMNGWAINASDNQTPGVLDAGLDSIEVGPIATDPLGMLAAWGIDDRTSDRVRYEVTPAAPLPTYWEIEVILRVDVLGDSIGGNADPLDPSTVVEYSEGSGGSRFGLIFGADGDGDAIVGFLGDARRFTLEGEGSSYHRYLLRSNGDLFVDGILRLQNYVGVGAGSVLTRFNFGDGSSAGIGRSHWNLVRFSSVTPGCDNGLDDDGDSLIDAFDPECSDAFDQELSTDTDGDGLSDDAEILTHGTDPTQADSDGDGVGDADEINGTMSNPNIAEIFEAEAWVSDLNWQRIFRVDLDSGDRSVLTSNAVGAGPGIFAPYGMTLEPDGQLLYADFGVAGVYRVDPQTGDRSLVGGSLLLNPVQLAIEPAGTILVTDFALDDVWRIDEGISEMEFSGAAQSGPVPTDLRDVEVSPNGSILVSDLALDSVLQIDPITGNRTEFSGPTVGNGQALSNPYTLAFDRWNDLWVGDTNTLFRMDAANGDRIVVSDATTGTGPAPGVWTGMDLDGQGRALMADTSLARLTRVNPFNGNREIISGAGVGAGDFFSSLREVVFYPGLDTDGDGLTDLFELEFGLDPTVPGEEMLDGDGDGLSNLLECKFGADPSLLDTDGDGISDGSEVLTHGTDPASADTDGDGSSDLEELNGGTTPWDPDTDDDGLLDGFETAAGFDPFSGGEALLDGDDDGLDNLAEQSAGSDPGVADTDGDGVSDGDEVSLTATDPTIVDAFRNQAWVSDVGTDTIVRVDLASGDRTVISGAGVGNGPNLGSAYGMALEPSGHLVIADFGANRLLRIDPANGNRTIVSDATTGFGETLIDPVGLGIEPSGDLLVTDFARDSLYRIDPVSGDRTSPCHASGPGVQVTNLRDVDYHSGSTYLADLGSDSIFLVDPLTRGRIEVTGATVGAGPTLIDPYAIEFDGAGDLWLLTPFELMKVDLANGDRTLVSGPGTGSGPAGLFYVGMDFDHLGRVLVTDINADSLVAIDPVSGDRVTLSDAVVGSGTGFSSAREVEFVPALDQDSDGLSDLVEMTHGFNPLVGGEQNQDLDGDGLTNGEEDDLGTGIDVADTDGDGLSDGDEVQIHGSDPFSTDTDGDGLADGMEIAVGSDPNVGDTDADGILDGADNCVVDSNPMQDDADLDERGDPCDNCLSTSNPAQRDWDNDLEGDLCDTDDGRLWFTQADKTMWTWQVDTNATEYSFYRGTLSYLRANGIYTQAPTNPEALRICGIPGNSVADPNVPAIGETAVYLVSGDPALNVWIGEDSGGFPRPNDNPCAP